MPYGQKQCCSIQNSFIYERSTRPYDLSCKPLGIWTEVACMNFAPFRAGAAKRSNRLVAGAGSANVMIPFCMVALWP
jgi:hypothetical protein